AAPGQQLPVPLELTPTGLPTAIGLPTAARVLLAGVAIVATRRGRPPPRAAAPFARARARSAPARGTRSATCPARAAGRSTATPRPPERRSRGARSGPG